MEAVESCCYKEGGAIDAVSDSKGGFVVLEALKESEVEAQQNG